MLDKLAPLKAQKCMVRKYDLIYSKSGLIMAGSGTYTVSESTLSGMLLTIRYKPFFAKI